MSRPSTVLEDLDNVSFLQHISADVRGARWDHDRLSWDCHVEKLTHEVNMLYASAGAGKKLIVV